MPSPRRTLLPILAIVLALAALPAFTRSEAGAATLSGQGAGYSPGWKILWGSDAELARDLDAMASTGARWMRVDFDWPSIQPTPTTWNWSATDRVVREATRRGMQVLALPTYTPSWQRPAGTTDKHAPRDPAAYAAFVRAAAQRYAPQGVRAWEIWNEANIVNFWQPLPDPVAYTRLLEAAAAAIRSVDPGATILTSGTSPADDSADGRRIHPVTFLRRIYEQGGRDSFDAVAHHPYSYPVNPTFAHRDNAFAGVTPALRDLMVANGDGAKQVWGTEFGAPTGTNPRAVTEAQQAAHLVEAYTAWSSWSWTGPLLWYNWRDTGTDPGDLEQNFGLVTEGFRAKPALAAMTTLFGGGTTGTTTTAVPSTPTTAPVPSGRLRRLAGSDRFATAVAVAADSHDGAHEGGVVFVASGTSYADALAGGAPAALEQAPMLLTERTSLPAGTRAELQRLRPRQVFVMGGPAQVSATVEQELRTLTGATVERLAGDDRYATAVRATQRFFAAGVDQLYIADGSSFADALAGGALAGRRGAPLLLAGRGGLSEVVRAEVRRLRPRSVVIAGGESAVPESVRLLLADLTDAPVRRVSGDDRYATAAALTGAGGAEAGTTYVASGRGFPDALAAAPAAALADGPILLVEADRIPAATRTALEQLAPESIVIVGGEAAVSRTVEAQLAALTVG